MSLGNGFPAIGQSEALEKRRTSVRRVARKSLRDTLATNNASDRYYAAMAGKSPAFQAAIAPKRAYTKRTASDDLEAAVSIEVGQVLATHPNVIFAVRQNTGAADMVGKGGKVYPVWFYRWVRCDGEITITDYWGFMFSPARFVVPFALECKRRDWCWSGIEREKQQRGFIDKIIDFGGRGGFVTSAEQALAILK